MYFDDVRLYRQCDDLFACWPSSGQICPQIVTAPPPNSPLAVQNISNANEMRVRLFVPGTSSLVWDTVYSNANGLPDVEIPAKLLATRFASNNYDAEITLENYCGAFVTSASIQILNGIFDSSATWVDTTADWSGVPKPCCLHTLTLSDMEIVGDVSYIVKDTIRIRDGVTAAAGSDILIQAGEVVEMDSVEFDGTVSTVEILEAPCQGCRPAPPSPGGTPPGLAEIGTVATLTANRPKPKETKGPPRSGPALDEVAAPGLPDDAAPATSAGEFGMRVHPNPFARSFSIGFTLPEPGPVSVTVFDALHRPVSVVLENAPKPMGFNRCEVDAGNWHSGMYFVRLDYGGRTLIRKVVRL